MKTSKKIISMLLCVVMVVSTFCGLGFVLEDFVAEAATFNPNITITHAESGISITQQRVVGTDNDAYLATYQEYQNRFMNGKMTNAPTNFVIPGLSSSDDYTPQGLAYWEEKDWFLISAYDNSGNKKASVVYVLDGQTAEFIKLLVLKNTDGTECSEHGGGLCCSKYNLYYTHSGSTIAYIPLSNIAKVVENTDAAYIQFVDRRNLKGELNGASTSYCSYGSGTLWTGNFYIKNNDNYGTAGNASSGSILLGYKLYGNSSDEEWAYFRNGANIMSLNSTAQQEVTSGNNTMKYTTKSTNGATVDIEGEATFDGTKNEITATFGTTPTYWEGSPLHTLRNGNDYRIEFDSDYEQVDFYLFAPGSGNPHTNFKSNYTKTQNADGTWHFKCDFTAGTALAGADTNWGSVEANDTNFSGKYSIRFDIDNDAYEAKTVKFHINNLSIRYVNSWVNKLDPDLMGTSCVGNPYYVIAFTGGANNIDKIQYAIHDQGKLYLSRSYSRKESENHIRELSVGYVDLNAPGDGEITVNGRTRRCHMVDFNNNFTLFGGSSNSNAQKAGRQKMLYMGEGLVSVGDNIYIINESAAWNYNGKESSKCPEPIDVMWKIDHHELLGEEKSYDDTTALCYQKVNDISELNIGDDYIIVHESPVKDSLTQNNYLYAIDAFGGYGDKYLPKQDDPSQLITGDSMGIVGYEIKDYEIDGDKLYLTAEDDAYTSMRWQIVGAGTDTLRINSKELHYASNNHLYLGSRLFSMTTDNMNDKLNYIHLEKYNGEAGNFRIFYQNGTNPAYYLWCNDGSNQSYIDTYTDYYKNHSALDYVPNYNKMTEQAGTFHCDADFQKGNTTDSGNLIGKSVGADMQIVNIYKRVSDPYSSTYNSRIYSDLRAELQADGTYNIILETYANSPLQYQTLAADRPTDFIFVLDGSSSMGSTDSVGYQRYGESNTLAISALTAEKDTKKPTSAKIHGYTYRAKDIYYKTSDSVYHPIYAAVRTYERSATKCKQSYWAYYCDNINDDNSPRYMLYSDGTVSATGITKSELETLVGNNTGYSAQVSDNSNDDRRETVVYTGVHYEYKNGSCPRIDSVRNTIDDLSRQIAANAASTGLNHRIAVTTFGSNSDGSYHNNNLYANQSTTAIGYTSTTAADYKNAFFDASSFDKVRYIVDHIDVSSGDGYPEFGFDMASNIVENSDSSYLGNGDRSVAIIMITDGVPGKGKSDTVAQANTAASNAIANALRAKNLGAYVYTVLIGENDKDGFNMDEYMDFTSSNYLFAEDMYNPGDKNISDINYYIDVPTGSSFNLDSIVNGIFDAVQSNSKNAMAKLNTNSVIREKLNDTFVIPNDYTVRTQTASIYYDELDRLHFKDPVSSSLTTTVDKTTKEIIVDGFDYSANCVTKSNEANGKKLIVTISGILPNMDKQEELYNTSINKHENTGIYESRAKMEANDAVKQFPTEYFSIPEYDFIMDYDLPMYDNEVNGTLCSVDSVIQRQSTYSNNLSTEDIEIAFANSNQDLVYTLKQDEGKGYVLIKRDDGTYDWFRINIIPASNVYYEESRLETKEINASYNAWLSEGSSTTTYQETSSDSDVYGYDTNYATANDFSNGTYFTTTVDNTHTRTETKTFTFTGKGFDLVSACGPETGILTVVVKKDGNLEKVFLVDTYYNDTTYGLLTQVPVVHFESDEYATRTVEVTGVYLKDVYEKDTEVQTAALEIDGTEIDAESAVVTPEETLDVFASLGMPELDDADIEVIWMDEGSVLNTSAEAATTADGDAEAYAARVASAKTLYIDGYRVYTPIDDDSSYIASEQEASYYNVEESLKESKFDTDIDLIDTLVAYVEGGYDGKEINFGNYSKNGLGGPANEVYLAKGQAISFKVATGASSRAAIAPSVMLGMRNVSGNAVAKVNDGEYTITSKTEMYYDVSSNLEGVGSPAVYTVTVTNTGDGVLAVNNIKLTNATLATTTTADLPMVASLMMMSATPVDESEVNNRGYETKYPDYVPSEPATTNPDPDLDPVSRPGDTRIDMGNVSDLIDNGSVTPASFLAALLEIFKKLFANIGKLIFSF